MQDPKYFPKNTPPAHEALVRLSLKIHAKCPVLGKKVVITGTSREDLNGKAGVATSFDHARGRYAVVLDKQGGKAIVLRPDKLRSR